MKLPYSQFPWHRSYKTDSLIDEYHENGYIVVKLDGVDYEMIKRHTEKSLESNKYSRLSDGWKTNKHIRALATNDYIVRIINRLYDKECFPFQTLNFMYGTEQPIHSDMVHFNSIPQHYMCAAWVALEDCSHDSGPLLVYPKSHRLPYLSLDLIGLSSINHQDVEAFDKLRSMYEQKVSEYIKCIGEPTKLLLNKGECVIWSANLLHGGSKIVDINKTRFSQVTHYYFEGCKYYTPWFSNKSHIHYTSPPVII
jgi:ectoine hydroxylase-related dioxygenase (phytanoyl-CoA dioxygenase family)